MTLGYGQGGNAEALSRTAGAVYQAYKRKSASAVKSHLNALQQYGGSSGVARLSPADAERVRTAQRWLQEQQAAKGDERTDIPISTVVEPDQSSGSSSDGGGSSGDPVKKKAQDFGVTEKDKRRLKQYEQQVDEQTEYDPTKRYFEVSAYRNILDMLKSYNGALDAVSRWIRNQLNPIAREREPGYPDKAETLRVHGGALKYLKENATGWSGWKYAFWLRPDLGSFNESVEGYPGIRPWVNEVLAKIGQPPAKYGDDRMPQTTPYDLLSLARSLNWEMNRVRLPLPHNFRQLSAMVEGRIYDDIEWEYNGRFIDLYSDNGIPSLFELIKVIPVLREEVKKMRTAVRKEIDAAKYAKEVEEETIRAEREEPNTREEEQQAAEERAQEVLEEKEAEYLADYDRLVEKHNKLVEEREAIADEYDQVLQDLDAAETPDEVQALEDEAGDLVGRFNDIETRRRNMLVQLDTLEQAIDGLETEKEELLKISASEQAAEIRQAMQDLQALKQDLAEADQLIAERVAEIEAGETTPEGEERRQIPESAENDELEKAQLAAQLERDQRAQELADQMLQLQQELLQVNQKLQNPGDADVEALRARRSALQGDIDNLRKQGQDLEQQNTGKGTGAGPLVVVGLLASLAMT